MSLKVLKAPPMRRTCLSFCISLLALIPSATVRAQMGGVDPDPGDRGTGGRNTIQGRVFFPSGRTVDHRLKVTLTSVGAGRDFFIYTDDSGAFTFRRLAGGTYTIVVDAGKEYLPARETVPIVEALRRGSSGETYTVQIQLQLKVDKSNKAAVVVATLASVPKPARSEYEKALQAERIDTKQAIEHLKNAVKLFPQFMLAYNELGAQYFRLGQLKDAAEALTKALEIDPNVFSPRLNYGIVLVLMKKYKEAEPELRRAVEKNDSSAAAHAYLGRTLADERKFDEAEKELKRGLSLGGDQTGWCYRYLGAIYKERGQKAQAADALEKYLKLYPKDKDADSIRQLIRELRGGQ